MFSTLSAPIECAASTPSFTQIRNGDVESLPAAPAGSLRVIVTPIRRPVRGDVEATQLYQYFDARGRRKESLFPQAQKEHPKIKNIVPCLLCKRKLSWGLCGAGALACENSEPCGADTLVRELSLISKRPTRTPARNSRAGSTRATPDHLPCDGSSDVAVSTSTCNFNAGSIPGG